MQGKRAKLTQSGSHYTALLTDFTSVTAFQPNEGPADLLKTGRAVPELKGATIIEILRHRYKSRATRQC
jgi:hypothetical protein